MSIGWSFVSLLMLLTVLLFTGNSGWLSSHHYVHAFSLFPPPSQSYPSVLVTSTISHPELKFSPWGGSANNMTINTINNDSVLPIFSINGNTGAKGVGFQSQIFNYGGNSISLIVGNVSKTSHVPYQKDKDVQVYFNFHLVGNGGYSSHVSFVQGPIYGLKEGWNGNHFFKTISSHSQNVINLNGSSVMRISIDVQKEATVNPLEFEIGFH